MKYGSICSGIESASVAWEPLGFKAQFLSEIEAFPRAVLQHRFPSVPLHGDFTTIQKGDYESIELLVGGTPCQSFSVAGLRKGLDDPRGNLMLGFGALAKRLAPRWVVWENVPGVLSSNAGRDFGTFLGMLGLIGYGFAYRVLDAQYVRVESHSRAVPQRRRRVFVVGYLGDWRPAAAVLFERESLQGYPPPRREAGQRIADSLTVGANQCSGFKSDFTEMSIASTLMNGSGNAAGHNARSGHCKDSHIVPVANPLTARMYKGINTTMDEGQTMIPVAHSLRAEHDGSEDGTGRGTPLVFQSKASSSQSMNPSEISPSLGVGISDGVAVAFAQNTRDEVREMDVVGALAAEPGMKQQSYIRNAMAVRRLTPRECERLQGFPDDWTLIPYRNKPAADGPRYKALGNSMAVNCMRWIGERIQKVNSIV